MPEKSSLRGPRRDEWVLLALALLIALGIGGVVYKRRHPPPIALPVAPPVSGPVGATPTPGKFRLEVGGTSQAEVRVDGRRVGVTPYAGELFPGGHTITVTKDGFLPLVRIVAGNGDVRIGDDLKPRP